MRIQFISALFLNTFQRIWQKSRRIWIIRKGNQRNVLDTLLLELHNNNSTQSSDAWEINNYILPIGQLSEEAQEARNKDWKRFTELNSRKTPRIDFSKDLLCMVLIFSDPMTSSLRKLPQRQSGNFFYRSVYSISKRDSIYRYTRRVAYSHLWPRQW
jgi:hypothetical protein